MLGSSSNPHMKLGEKIREWGYHFWMKSKGLLRRSDPSWLFDILADYEAHLLKYAGMALQDAETLEIGFGARPYRMIILISLGVDARGVDLDHPVLLGKAREFGRVYRQNGLERVVKSLVRHYIFDKRERNAIAHALNERGAQLVIAPERFIVNDAAAPAFDAMIEKNSLDLVFSEDVFEHVPRQSLSRLVGNIWQWLRPSGLALIRPCVYTGIMGGHLAEWYGHTLDKKMHRRSEPWEHLRKKRYAPNTYLNEISREDYRKIFSQYFTIMEEQVELPDLGRNFLTDEVRSDLQQFSEEELFSNRVLFVLKPKVAL